jgi:hypothetical protein
MAPLRKPAQPKGPTSHPTYREFVGTHGGKSTKRLAELWKARFGGENRARLDALNPGGVQQPGNEGIERPAFNLPRALQPPVGGAPPTPPPTTGEVPTAQPPEPAPTPAVGSETAESAIPTGRSSDSALASAVSDFVRGSGAPSVAPMDEPVIQQPGDPPGSYRAFEGAPPQMGPTTEPAQQLAAQEGDPGIELLLQRYKQGRG